MKLNEIFRKTAVALAVAALMTTLGAAGQTLRGDFNMDGEINVTDITTMTSYLLSGRLTNPVLVHDTVMVNGESFVMVLVKGGTYSLQMHGCNTVGDYWIGQTEVTEGLWMAVMGTTSDGYNKEPGQPVLNVTWNQCQVFIDSLNAMTGMAFRLPTEDEWEYAAAGGRQTMGFLYSGSNDIDEVAWYNDNYDHEQYAMPVGTKEPNELGLYDMSGSAWEWCLEARGFSQEISCVRGGGLHSTAEQCRVTSMRTKSRNQNEWDFGLRLVRPAEQ